MPLTCNAVGDVLALIQLAIDVSKFLSDCRGAPAECRALCDELRSLERLLVLSKPTILALQDESLRELVAERLRMVSTHIDEGLRLVIKFSSAFDVSMPADPAQSWRTTMLHWVTKASQSVQWRLRRSADATACRMAIAHSFQPLTFAVLVAFQGDQTAVLRLLQDASTEITDHVMASSETMRDLAAGQHTLRMDALLSKEASNKHLVALQSVREEFSSARVQFTDSLSSSTQTIVDSIAQESDSTRRIMEAIFMAISNNRIADLARRSKEQRERSEFMELMTQYMQKQDRHNPVQQLREATVRVLKISPHILPVISRALISDEAIATTMVLAVSASSKTDRAAYGLTAFILVIARKVHQLYKAPVIARVIFVEDFFGYALEIPLSKSSNSRDFHAALIETFRGRMGLVLIQRRKYQLELITCSFLAQQTLPWTWEHRLEPGARIRMNSYILDHIPTDGGVSCPACTNQVSQSDQWSIPDHSWFTCGFCRTMIQVSRQADNNTQNVQPPQDSTTDFPPATSSISSLNESSTDDLGEQAALSRCRRIRIIQLTFSKLQSASKVSPAETVQLMQAAEPAPKEEPQPMPAAVLASVKTVPPMHAAEPAPKQEAQPMPVAVLAAVEMVQPKLVMEPVLEEVAQLMSVARPAPQGTVKFMDRKVKASPKSTRSARTGCKTSSGGGGAG